MESAADMQAEALELLDVGVGVFDRDLRLRFCNRAFRVLRRYPESICSAGVTLGDLLRFNAERGDFGDGDVDAQVAGRMRDHARTKVSGTDQLAFVRIATDPRVYERPLDP